MKETLMSQTIPAEYRDLFNNRAFASLGTVRPNGSARVTPVWCDIEDEFVILNTAKGRHQDRNIRRDGRVALVIVDPDNPYRYIQIRGRVEHVTEEGASAHIDSLAKKYLGKDKYPWAQPGQVRVIFEIEPAAVQAQG